MTETRLIVACTERQVHWYLGAEPAKCSDPGHQHRQVEDHLDWPDFGVPGDPALLLTALRSVIDRARTGEWVEVGCLGGHGRTGTALACLAVLTGYPAAGAVAWVRTSYCQRAVETAGQEAFITGFRC